MGIGWRGVDQNGIEGQGAALEQLRDLGQEDRHVVGSPVIDRLTGIGPHE